MVIMRNVLIFFGAFCNSEINNQRFVANFVIGDKAGFPLNVAVNNHYVRIYA